MDLSKKTVEELKALAYDQLVQLQITQRNINLLDEAIAKKQAEPKDVNDAKTPKDK